MKQIFLASILILCTIYSSLAQNKPINLVKKASTLVKDSADLVENKKDLIQETKALIRDVQSLGKKTKFKKKVNYQIGLTFQPFNFQNYQSQKGTGGTKLIKAKIFNGFAFGLTFRKKLRNHFSLKAEITYATQSEKFSSTAFVTSDADGSNQQHIYNVEGKLKYNITRLPLLINYSLKLGSNGWFIHGHTGLQLAYLNNYTRTHMTYTVNEVGGSFIIDRELLFSELFEKNGKGYLKILDPSNPDADSDGYVQYATFDEPKDVLFRTWSLAVVSGLEVEKKISANYSIGFGIQYEYNLTKTESDKYEGDMPIIYSVFSLDKGSTSHQKRIGMTFSILKTIH